MSETSVMGLSHLNARQLDVVLHADEAPLLVLAAAGTGKTEALTTRIAHLVRDRGVPHRALLAVTFTSKAAREMRERASRLCGVPEADLEIGTFHGICARMLRTHPAHSGFTILDQGDALKVLAACCEGLPEPPSPSDPSPSARVKAASWPPKPAAVYAQMNKWRNDGLEPREVEDRVCDEAGREGPALRYALDAYEAFRAACRKANTVDFSDLLMHVVSLCRTDPAFLERLHARWTHVLVDEYQDTNAVQMELVKHLVSGGARLTAVGDDAQAIHEWRGARVKNILEFETHFPGSVTVKLERNYRSVGTVLTAANNVIANNVQRTDKLLEGTRERGGPIRVVRYACDRSEARGVAASIRKAVAEDGFAYGGVAVLYRINSLSQVLEEAMVEAGVPYRMTGALSFFDRAEVKDALAYLRLAANPLSDTDFVRAVNMPPRGVGPSTLASLRQTAAAAGGTSLAAAAYAALRGGEGVKGLKGRAGKGLREFLRAVWGDVDSPPEVPEEHDDVAAAAVRIVTASGYLAHLAGGVSNEQGKERADNVQALLSLCRRVGDEALGDRPASLDELLSHMATSARGDGDGEGAEAEAEGGRVTLMTMHASKGLEFPLVHLVGMCEGMMPFFMAVNEGRIEEERRLAYVGITRAKDRLTLSYPASSTMYFGTIKQSPSRFLEEMQPVEVTSD